MSFKDKWFRFALIGVVSTMALTGCHSLFGSDDEDADKKDSAGKRVSILEVSKRPIADPDVSDTKISLPKATVNRDWAQAGGNAAHNLSQPSLAVTPEEIWRADIGDGSDSDFKLLARPVVSDGVVFTLDSRGMISAFKTKDGGRIWHFDSTPPERDEAMGGGLGVANRIVYVTTGFGEVLALKTADGSVMWRKMLDKPIRSAPTIGAQQVYVVSIDNELTALSTKNGEVLWHHNGIAESATLMGASSPAIYNDSIIAAYTSGEIFNLRSQNGHVAWSDVLASPAQVGALPAIADIRGLPVISDNRVFAISHSDRIASIDMRSGDQVWEADIGGTNTPIVSGNAVYILSNESELIALTRESGRVIWINQLQQLEDPTDHDSAPILWSGPLLAGGRLWLTNSDGHLVSFSPLTGKQLEDKELGSSFFIPPIAADNIMYVVSDNGYLIALH